MAREKRDTLKDLGRFYLRTQALKLGLADGHSDYCRFIILGTARSGSNFLRGLLNSHTQIVAFGELFRSHDSIGWELPPYDTYLQSRRLISLMHSNPGGFLEKKVFTRFPRHIAAVGFKIFYYHAQDDSRTGVWAYLRDRKDLRIIHLKRHNTLRVIISLKKAFVTNRWTNTTGIEEGSPVLPLDYEECLEAFTWAQETKRRYDTYFKDSNKLDVCYETLSSHYEREMKRVQEFLGTDFEAVKPATFRQAHQPLSQTISNYWELKERFTGTPWEVFFED